jgi:hypothetical protein
LHYLFHNYYKDFKNIKYFTKNITFITLYLVENIIYISKGGFSMKKIFSLAVLLLLVFTVACTQAEEETKNNTDDNKQEEKVDKTEVEKKALVTFEIEMADIMHINGPALASLAAAQADYADPEIAEEDKPTKEELENLKSEAQKAAKEMATAVSVLTIPSDLSDDNQAALKAAVENFVKGMEWNAENIPSIPAEETTEGANLIAEFDKGINDLHTKLGLVPVKNFSQEIY